MRVDLKGPAAMNSSGTLSDVECGKSRANRKACDKAARLRPPPSLFGLTWTATFSDRRSAGGKVSADIGVPTPRAAPAHAANPET